MRIYISIDMEGIAGVVHEDQTNPIDPRCAGEYGRFRRLMTAEASAAVAGAFDGGAGKVWVNDSHWTMRNLLAEELDPRAELVSGDPKPWSMVQGIDQGFDAALFIGYHARAGTPHAILDHTYTDRVREVRINGRPFGEIGLNAAVAGAHGVPVALVTGDRAAAAEAAEFLGDVATVAVKDAVGRHAARSLSPEAARARIREAAAAALRTRRQPFQLAGPLELAVDFALTAHADMAELVPGSRREGGRTVRYGHDDYLQLFRAWRAMYNLSALAV